MIIRSWAQLAPASDEAGMLGIIFLVILIVTLFAVVPVWPHSREWGHYPAAVLSLLLLVWIGLIWFGFVAFWWPRAAY
jgi:hypothetical protein